MIADGESGQRERLARADSKSGLQERTARADAAADSTVAVSKKIVASVILTQTRKQRIQAGTGGETVAKLHGGNLSVNIVLALVLLLLHSSSP